MNIEKLKTDLHTICKKHGVTDFICLVTFENAPEMQIHSISHINEKSHCKDFFQWLRRQIILKLQ